MKVTFRGCHILNLRAVLPFNVMRRPYAGFEKEFPMAQLAMFSKCYGVTSAVNYLTLSLVKLAVGFSTLYMVNMILNKRSRVPVSPFRVTFLPVRKAGIPLKPEPGTPGFPGRNKNNN